MLNLMLDLINSLQINHKQEQIHTPAMDRFLPTGALL